jgi:hypothetical protein
MADFNNILQLFYNILHLGDDGCTSLPHRDHTIIRLSVHFGDCCWLHVVGVLGLHPFLVFTYLAVPQLVQ